MSSYDFMQDLVSLFYRDESYIRTDSRNSFDPRITVRGVGSIELVLVPHLYLLAFIST